MGTAVRWFRQWWLTIPEPRDLSLVWAVAYLVLAAAGVAAVFAPPHAIVAVFSWPALAAVGWLLIVGAVLAMVGGWREFWKLERVGIAGMGGASLLFALIALGLPRDDLVGVVLGYVAFAIITLTARYLMIWRFAYRPRG